MANKITGTYSNGSSGKEVRQIQQKLIAEGYGDYLGKGQDDGIFGADTADAVKRYQQANSLAVDGIVGEETLASLFGSDTGSAPTGTTNPNAGSPAAAAPAKPAAPVTSPGGVTYGDFSYADFNPMDDPYIQQAQNILDQLNANKPGEWADPFKDKWMGYADQMENRDPFSYDPNSDALYNQYKDMFVQHGKMSMMDTMGQAAALTGGYGNSYAQTVGQQAYNQQLNQLNEIVPELYGMAYDQYKQEGQDLRDMYSLYKGLSEQDYAMHQDELGNWYKDVGLATDAYNTAYDRGWNEHMVDYNTAWDEYLTSRNEKFTESENEKSRIERERASAKSDLINLITSTGYNPTDSELAAAGMSREQANSYADAYAKAKTGEYEKLLPGTDAYGIVEKAIKGAKDLDDLNRITQEYISIYGEDAIKRMGAFQKKIEELTPKRKPNLPPLPTTGDDSRFETR